MRNLFVASIAIAAGLMSVPAVASSLDVLGAKIDLPFEFRVAESTETFSGSFGLTASQLMRVERIDGAATTSVLLINAAYTAPGLSDSGLIAGVVRSQSEQAAAAPGVRVVTPVEIGGFHFILTEGESGNREFPQRVLLYGAIGASIYRLNILANDATLVDAAFIERLKGMSLQYADLLRTRARYDEEARLAVRGNAFESPLGRMTLGRDLRPRLVDSLIRRDATGKVVFRRRSFGVYRVGFWSVQNLFLAFSCGRASQKDEYENFIGMTAELSVRDEQNRYTEAGRPRPATFMGIAGTTVDGKGPPLNAFRHSIIRRWAARRGDEVFFAHVQRFNASGVESALDAQLASLTPVCRTDLAFVPMPASVENSAGATDAAGQDADRSATQPPADAR